MDMILVYREFELDIFLGNLKICNNNFSKF